MVFGLTLADKRLRPVRRPLVIALTVISVLLTLHVLRAEPLRWVRLSGPKLALDPSRSTIKQHELAIVQQQGNFYNSFPRPTTAQLVKDFGIRPIKAHQDISDECLDHWVSNSVWDGPCTAQSVEESVIDILWTWVNGSDPLHEQTRGHYIQETGHHPKNARFREHDELRASLRSAMHATGKWRKNAWHIITPDVENPDDSNQRLGLLPQWANTEVTPNRVGDRAPIVFHHDSQLFRYARTGRYTYGTDEVEQWRARVLPTFNSHAIEVQFSNLDPNAVSDNIIAVNDDQYLVLPMPPAAFHSPLYGPVFRIDRGTKVGGDDTGTFDSTGEWLSLGWTCHVLNQRFGTRYRPYVVHNARSLSLPLMHEASLAMADNYAYTPLSRFRGMHHVPPEVEVNTIFASTHFVIERHREALLWSWVVAKWGGRDGVLTPEKKHLMWLEMGGKAEKDMIDPVKITRKRTTRDDVTKNLQDAGLQTPSSSASKESIGDTSYTWTSHDGYQVQWNLPPSISRERCLGSTSERAWDRFLELAQGSKLACGDAILTMLKTTSESSGLAIYLPPASTPMRVPANEPVTLPVVLPKDPPALPTNTRTWAVRLIHRYSYVTATSPTRFFGIETMKGAKMHMKAIDASRTLAFLCINDDMPEEEEDQREMDLLYREYLRKKFPVPLDCEISY